MVTIKDVAKAAGVSVATVSRAINNRGNVAPEVRTHVLGIAKELRYVPHAGATSLSSRRTNMVALVLPELHGEFLSELMKGVDSVTRNYNLHLMVANYRSDLDSKKEVLSNIRSRVDGVLIHSPFHSKLEDFLELTEVGKPFVVLNSPAPIDGAMQVAVDNYGGGVQMTEHLINQGFSRIAFISGPAGNTDSQRRLDGYRETLNRLLPGAKPVVFEGNFNEESGYAIGKKIAEDFKRGVSGDRIDAVFCANDMMALGLQRAAAEEGLRIPQDIAVAGFDDVPSARYMPVGLTTIRTDTEKFGARAATLLVHLMNGGELLVNSELLRSELVVRDSTARVK